MGRVVGDTGSTLWYTSTAPTYANSKYTFTISNLSGRSGLSVSVNDVIFYSTYYYIVSTVGSTTVDCATRVSIKGSDASVTIVDNLTSDSSTSVLSAKQGKVLNTNKIETSAIATSFGSTTSDSKVPSEKLVKDSLDKVHSHFYGTSSTGASTQVKEVTATDFVLTTGVLLSVKFTNKNTYNGTAQLKVNSESAVDIATVGTTKTSRYHWVDGEVVSFVYDGTNFVMLNDGLATTTYYGVTKLSSSTSSTSEAMASTPKAVKTAYDLANGKADVSHTHSINDVTDYPLFCECTGGISTATYVNILEITVTESNKNAPITMAVRKKGNSIPTYMSIKLSNTDITQADYSIDSFIAWGEKSTYYLRQSEANKFVLIAYKGENNSLKVTDLYNPNDGVSITVLDTNYGSQPVSTTTNPVWTATYTVGGTEIVDNLTTNDASKVLSAKQGKALNDLIGNAITYINQ